MGSYRLRKHCRNWYRNDRKNLKTLVCQNLWRSIINVCNDTLGHAAISNLHHVNNRNDYHSFRSDLAGVKTLECAIDFVLFSGSQERPVGERWPAKSPLRRALPGGYSLGTSLRSAYEYRMSMLKHAYWDSFTFDPVLWWNRWCCAPFPENRELRRRSVHSHSNPLTIYERNVK